jgi:hypothetical protein
MGNGVVRYSKCRREAAEVGVRPAPFAFPSRGITPGHAHVSPPPTSQPGPGQGRAGPRDGPRTLGGPIGVGRSEGSVGSFFPEETHESCTSHGDGAAIIRQLH